MKIAIYILMIIVGIFNLGLFAQDSNEPNNSFQEVTPLALDADINGTIDPVGDFDYFSITLEQDGVVEINITDVDPTVRMQVTLYDSSQAIVFGPQIGGAGAALSLDFLTDAGQYFLVLSDWQNNNSGSTIYTLNVALDTSDPYELNNSFGDAKAILLGNDINGTIRSVGDKDYFSLTLDQDGVLEINITDVDPTVRMQVTLYDIDQNVVYGPIIGGAGAALDLNFLTGTGQYYLVLSDWQNNNSGTTVYTLNLELDTSDPNELNNGFDDATSILLGADINGTIRSVGDKDYYSFALEEAGVIEIDITNVDPTVRMQVTLYDIEQNVIYGPIIGGAGVAQHLDFLADAGQYFLLLSDWQDNNSGTTIYTLNVNLDTSDANELNNDFNTATLLDSGVIVNGTIRSVGDKDFYTFETIQQGPEALQVNVFNVDPSVRMQALIYDSFQIFLGNNVASINGGPINWSFTLPASGKYYLVLEDWQNNNSGTGIYSMVATNIEFLPPSAVEPSESLDVLSSFQLHSNYPNPFNPTTTIEYQLPKKSDIRLSIYNSLGQLVRVLVDDRALAGRYNVTWDGRNHSGVEAPSGVYFYTLSAGQFTETHKMLLIR